MRLNSKLAIWGLFLGAGLAVAALDLWTKEIAFAALGVEVDTTGERPILRNRQGLVDLHGNPPRENIVLIEDLFEFEASLNYGAFSGWFGEHTEWLAVLSFVALIVIAGFLWFAVRGGGAVSFWIVLALGLLWGGTLGNFYDRSVIGGVRDFIKWFVVIDGEQYVWPNFNIADSAICTGVGLIIVLELVRIIRRPKGESARE